MVTGNTTVPYTIYPEQNSPKPHTHLPSPPPVPNLRIWSTLSQAAPSLTQGPALRRLRALCSEHPMNVTTALVSETRRGQSTREKMREPTRRDAGEVRGPLKKLFSPQCQPLTGSPCLRLLALRKVSFSIHTGYLLSPWEHHGRGCEARHWDAPGSEPRIGR